MNTIQITDLADLKPGDTATFEVTYDGHTAALTGDVHRLDGGSLAIWDATVRYANGNPVTRCTFISATRPAPALPTEPGSVILASEMYGSPLIIPMHLMLSSTGYETGWVSETPTAASTWHRPEHITAWTLAKVVPA